MNQTQIWKGNLSSRILIIGHDPRRGKRVNYKNDKSFLMPYFVKVGLEENNNCLTTAKGYYLRRKGSWVITKWAAIDVVGQRQNKFFWHTYYLQSKTHKLRTIEKAKEFYKYKVEQRYWRGYKKLPPGVRIYQKKLQL